MLKGCVDFDGYHVVKVGDRIEDFDAADRGVRVTGCAL